MHKNVLIDEVFFKGHRCVFTFNYSIPLDQRESSTDSFQMTINNLLNLV